jgi:hypothetical protein
MNSKHDYNSEEYKQAVLRARGMTPEEKFSEGPRLFAEECEQMKATIRKEMTELSEEMVEHELRSRLEHRREEEERGIYIKLPVGWKPYA